MSSDKVSACWDVLCFVDKAIIHHYALDSKNPPSISGICFLRIVDSLIYFGRWVVLAFILLLITVEFKKNEIPYFGLDRN